MTDETEHRKTKLNFSVRLALGIATLLLLGLVTIFVIVNTMVRGIIYDNVIGAAQRDKIIYANEIDAWFSIPKQTVRSLATVLGALPSEQHFADIAESFVADHDFIENAFIGFADGSVINGLGWTPDDAGNELDGVGWGPWEHWRSTERPWFIAAIAADGDMAATKPYLSQSTGNMTVAIGTWMPELGGVGATVGFSISIDYILHNVGRHPVTGCGYLILVGSEGGIIVHPNPEYAPCSCCSGGYLHNIRYIPNGEFMMEHIAIGNDFVEFNDPNLGPSYFLSTPLRNIDWTLVAVIPIEATRLIVLRYLNLIMVTFAVLLIALFTFTMFFVSYLVRSMEERRASEERLRIIIDNMPWVANISGKDSAIIECNEEAPRLFGLRDKQEYIERFFELQPSFQPDGRDSMEKALVMDAIAFETGHNRFEWMHRHINGEPIPCEITLIRVKWFGEDQLLSFIRDLREFYEAQKRERLIIERTQLMLDATPLMIQYWDRAYNYIDCNKTTLDFYGFSTKEEYKGRSRDVMPDVQPDGMYSWVIWKKFLGRIFENGFDSIDFVEKKLSGEPVFLEVVGYRMEYNNDMVAVTYANDVTQLKQSLERMQEAEERAQLMLDGTPVACYLINSNFDAIDCNKEALNLFDFANKAAGIENFREIFLQYRFDRLNKHFSKALKIGAERFEWILQKPNDGEYIPCDIAFIRFSHKGEYVVAAYIFDLRVLKEMLWERQRVETAEENNRAKSRFLARMSHEVRTPITAVLGISEIQLQDPTLSPHTEEAFVKIHDSASILLQIVNDILDLSKIEAGKMSLLNEEYQVASLINDMVQLHLVYIGSRKIEFHVHVDESLPTVLVGDELRIKQIVSNLLSNALKYTESGSVELSLRCQKAATEEDMTLVLGIRDTGQGMTPEQIDAMYSEYTRFNERENRNMSGTGLGMPIVYSLVQMMDAKIDVESELGKGTNVIVRIPQKIASQEVLGAEVAHSLRHLETNARSAAKRFKFVPELMPYGSVLVVDDVEANLYVAQGLLTFYGLKIEVCDSGEAAIEKVSQGNVYDIIFMDQMMPGMNGTETMKALRAFGYTHPIVALTANALIGQAGGFLRDGFDGFISKPIQTMHLNTILTKYIRDKQPPEVLEAAATAGKGFRPGAFDTGIDGYLNRPEVATKLRVDFAESQKDVFVDISAALDTGDIDTAYRLIHTLKGLAGLIHEDALVRATVKVEQVLKDGNMPSANLLNALEGELIRVLGQIEMPDTTALPNDTVFDKEKAKVLLDKLHELIMTDSAEALNLLEELRMIPQANDLFMQVKECDFEAAAKVLKNLRATLDV